MKPEDKAKVQQALELLDKQWQCSEVWSLEESQESAEALRQLLEAEPVQDSGQFDPKFLDDLKKLMGLPPYNESSNTAMGDGYFSAHLIRTHGKEKFDAAVAYLRSEVFSTPPAQPAAQPADHSEQHLDMVDHGDELTIAYLNGVHAGKQLAKREWVGLTEEELKSMWDMHSDVCGEIAMHDRHAIAYAIEAKLREKNGGEA